MKYGLTGSGSGKTSFFQSFKQNSFSVYVFAQVLVTNAQDLLDLTSTRLTEEAAALYRERPEAFVQQFGDSFVYGLITGGEFLGILEIETSSAEELRQVKASIGGKATFGLFSGSASGAFSQSLEKIVSSYSMKAFIMRQGGTGSLASVSPDALVSQALSFPDAVIGRNGFPYKVLTIPYNHIPHPESTPIDTANQLSVLERLGSLRLRIIRLQSDIDYALSHSDQFPDLDRRQASQRSNDLSSELDKVVASSRECFLNGTRCSVPQLNLDLLASIIPEQSNAVGKKMISGTVSKGYYETTHPFMTLEPIGPRSDTIRVDFPAGSFSSNPKVETMLSSIDTEHLANTRLTASASNISINGFDLVIATWADSRVYGVTVTWLAYQP
jgi:hypothetical protein